MKGTKNFEETELPRREDFFSKLNGKHISEEDHKHAQNIWKQIKCKTIGYFHDFYLKTDITNIKVFIKPKDPGRVAAGKKLAELNKKRREEKRKADELERQNKVSQKNLNHAEEEEKVSVNNSFFQGVSFNQIISAAGIIVSLVGLYLKREELMSALQSQKKQKTKNSTSRGKHKRKC